MLAKRRFFPARFPSPPVLALAPVFALGPLLAGSASAQAPAAPAAPAPVAAPARPPAPVVASLEKLKALAGDWVDADAAGAARDEVKVTYRVTGAGSAVVETLAVGKPYEMVSVYHRDGTDLVMTHYCAAGNQPRMRAKPMTGNVLVLDFAGGTNLDPAKDAHIHSVRLEFVSADEVRAEWFGWVDGKPGEEVTKFHLKRKKAGA